MIASDWMPLSIKCGRCKLDIFDTFKVSRPRSAVVGKCGCTLCSKCNSEVTNPTGVHPPLAARDTLYPCPFACREDRGGLLSFSYRSPPNRTTNKASQLLARHNSMLDRLKQQEALLDKREHTLRELENDGRTNVYKRRKKRYRMKREGHYLRCPFCDNHVRLLVMEDPALAQNLQDDNVISYTPPDKLGRQDIIVVDESAPAPNGVRKSNAWKKMKRHMVKGCPAKVDSNMLPAFYQSGK